MEFEIKAMQPEDVPAVARLETVSFSHPWSENALMESLQTPNYYFFTAKKDGNLVGYVGAYLAADELSITNIAVFPLWKRKGIGALLLKSLDEIAVWRSLYGITLEVRVSNAAAIALYEKAGYQGAGVRKRFYDNPTEDALIMWKYFS